MKCSGDKPTCYRCEKRGFQCEYLEAKRAGRKPAASSSSGSTNSAGSASRSASDQGQSNEGAVALASPKDGLLEHNDLWHELNDFDRSMLTDFAGVTGTPSGFSPTFGMELPAFDMAAPTAQMTNMETLCPSAIDNALNAGMSSLSAATLEASNTAAADLFAFPEPTPGATGFATPVSRDSQNVQRSPNATPFCSCFIQSLLLLKALTEATPLFNVPATRPDQHTDHTVQSAIRHNKVAVDTAIGMLNCSGRHDGYLLIILCLTAFKTLDVFAAILPEVPDSRMGQCNSSSGSTLPGPRRTSTSDAEDFRGGSGDWARQSTQTILGELHGVRNLTRLVSTRLQAQAAVRSAASSSARSSSTASTTPDSVEERLRPLREDVWSYFEAILPLSAQLYLQLDMDLDRRVKALCQQIVQRLRKF